MLPGLTSFVPEAALTAFDNLEFFIRIVLAAALGALVGLERSKRQKEAGVRTHCIIACTSALFMILSSTPLWIWWALTACGVRILPASRRRWSAAFPFWAPALSLRTETPSGV